MLIVLSPAKSLDFTAGPPAAPLTLPQLADQTAELAKVTRKLRAADLKRMMSLSDNLAQLNRERFQAFDPAMEDTSRLRQGPHGTEPGSLGAVVQNWKSTATRRINQMRHTPGARVWQDSYYEHIIRNERELWAIRQYIENNPAQWAQDREHPRNVRR